MIKKHIQKAKERRAVGKKHINSKLLRRLKIFAVIIVIIMVIAGYKIFLGKISFELSIISLAIGTVIGFIGGRMFKIFWHPETQEVVSRLDKIGFIFLVLYIGVEVGKKWIFGHWLQGDELNSFGLIFLEGLLLGRLLSMKNNIRKVLIEQNKI